MDEAIHICDTSKEQIKMVSEEINVKQIEIRRVGRLHLYFSRILLLQLNE